MTNEQFKTSGVPGADLVPELEVLLESVRGAGMEQYLAAILGTEELNASAEPARLVSLCAGVEYLAQKEAGAALAAAGEKAAALRKSWMDASFAAADRRVHFLNRLVKAAGLESQSAFLERYRIFMDGSILCAEGISDFLDRLLPAMTAMNSPAKITVPHCVVKQMEGLMANAVTMELSGAKGGLEQLRRIQEAQMLSVRGDENDTTTMSTFISAFSRFKPSNNLVLLTEDPILAGAVATLNSIGIEGDDILVATLSTDGVVRVWGEPEEEPRVMEEPAVVSEPASEAVMPAEEDEAAAEVSDAIIPCADFCAIPFDEALDGGDGEENADFLTPVPMDEPLDGGNAWVPQEKLTEQVEDDEDDEEDDAGEEKLEKYLQISGLLQLSDDEENSDDEFFLSEEADDNLEEEIVFLEEEDDEAFAEDTILLEDIEEFEEDAEDTAALPAEDEEKLATSQAQAEPALRMSEQIGSLEELDELEVIDGFEVSVSKLEWEPLD